MSIAGEVGWRGSRSQVVCLQETLNAFYGDGMTTYPIDRGALKVDGVLGPRTQHAWYEYFKSTRSDQGQTWLDWLKMIAFDPPKDGA